MTRKRPSPYHRLIWQEELWFLRCHPNRSAQHIEARIAELLSKLESAP